MSYPFPISFCPIPSPSYVIPINQTNLLFYVDANNYGGSGDWIDETGNGYDFVPQNSPTFTSASNSYFTLDNSPPANEEMFLCIFSPSINMNEWSLHIWMYHTANGTETWQTVFDKDDDEELVLLYGTSTPEMSMWSPTVFSGHNIADNTWLNLVWTYEEDNPGPPNDGICKFYVNGVRVPTPSSQFVHSDTSSTASQMSIGGGWIGGGGGSPNEVLDARIGECGVYENLAMSDAQVLSNFNATKVRYGY